MIELGVTCEAAVRECRVAGVDVAAFVANAWAKTMYGLMHMDQLQQP